MLIIFLPSLLVNKITFFFYALALDLARPATKKELRDAGLWDNVVNKEDYSCAEDELEGYLFCKTISERIGHKLHKIKHRVVSLAQLASYRGENPGLLKKPVTGIFTGVDGSIKVVEDSWKIAKRLKIIPEIRSKAGKLVDGYLIPRPDSGYIMRYGKLTDEKCDYVMIINVHDTNEVITAFPTTKTLMYEARNMK